MIVRDLLAKAEHEARSAISQIDSDFALAALPLTAPPNASPGHLLVLGIRNRSSDTSGTDLKIEIKRVRTVAMARLKAAAAHIDAAEAGARYFRAASRFINGDGEFPTLPPGVPEQIAAHLRMLKTFATAGVIVSGEVCNAVDEAGSKGMQLVREARKDFARFELTLGIALCKQAAKYCRKWNRDYMAAGYDKRAERLSRKYRLWAAAPRGAEALRAELAISATGGQ